MDRREGLLQHAAQPASAPIVAAPETKKAMSRLHVSLLIGLCFWMTISGSTLYMWATLEKDIQDHCGWDASDTNTVYSTGMVAGVVGFVPGLLFNRYGARASLLFSLLFCVAGGACWYWSLNSNAGAGAGLETVGAEGGRDENARNSVCSSPYVMGLFYFLAISGSTSMGQTGIFTALNVVADARAHWPAEDRPRWLSIGVVAGVVTSGFGLGSAVWSAVYNSLEPGDTQLRHWIGIMTTCWTATALLAMVVLPNERLSGSGTTTATGQRNTESRTPLTDAENQQGASGSAGDVGTITAAADLYDERTKQAQFDGDWRAVIRTPTFWSIILQFVILSTIGCGLFIGNLTYLTGSFQYSRRTQHLAVEIIGYANCAGRLLFGVLMDTAGASVRKDRWFLLTGAITLLGCLSILQGLALDLLPCILVGLAYGGNWAVMPAAITEEFGKRNTMFGFCSCAFFLAGGVKGVSVLTGHFYDLHKREWVQEHPHYTADTFCHPVRTCFREVSWVTVGLCALSLGLGATLMFVMGGGRSGSGPSSGPAKSPEVAPADAVARKPQPDPRDGLLQYPSIPSVGEANTPQRSTMTPGSRSGSPG